MPPACGCSRSSTPTRRPSRSASPRTACRRRSSSGAARTRARPRPRCVQDPDGEWVELVVVPGASAAQLARFEIGITVGDLAASRAFYGELMGLEAQPSVRDELLGVVKYPFKHGSTDDQSVVGRRGRAEGRATAGMQYIVWNVAAIDGVVQRARREDRSAAVGAGADANAVARRSRRRQQLLRGVRGQRQRRARRSLISS